MKKRFLIASTVVLCVVSATVAEKPRQQAAPSAAADADESIPVPIETALPPPAPGEKRGTPSLQHPDPVLRRNAIHGLKWRGGFGDPIPLKQAVTELTPALKDSDAGVREAAAHALGSMGRLARPAVPGLAANLKDPEFRVRYFTAAALRNLRQDAKEAVPALIEALKDTNGGVRVEAAEALVKADPSQKTAVVSVLKAVLGDDAQKTWVRVRAGQVLVDVDPEQAKTFTAALNTALKHPDPALRVRAAATLARADAAETNRVVTFLLDLMAKGFAAAPAGPQPRAVGQPRPGYEVAQEASQALVAIGPRALPALEAAFKTANDSLKQQIINQLGTLGSAALPLALEALKDQNPSIRQQATWILSSMGPAAKQALPAIRESLRNPPKPPTPKEPAKSGDGPRSAPYQPDPRVQELQIVAQIDPSGWIPQALELLRDDKPQVRSEVLNLLMFMGVKDPAVQRVLRDALRGDDKNLASQALNMLPYAGLSKDAVPAVIVALRTLGTELPFARRAGIQFLGEQGADARAAVPILVKALNDPETRHEAAAALARIDPNQAKSIVPVLVEELGNAKPGARIRAAQTLLKVDPSQVAKAMPVLIEALKAPIADQTHGGPAMTGNDDVPPDPTSVAIALGQLGPVAKEAAPLVLTIARHPNVFSFSRMGLAESAAKLDPAMVKDASELLSALVYDSPNPFLRADAAAPLVRVDPSQAKRAIATLTDTLDHLHEQGMGMGQKLASRVIAGLAGMGPAGTDAVPALKKIEGGPDAYLAKLAKDALRKIQPSSSSPVQHP